MLGSPDLLKPYVFLPTMTMMTTATTTDGQEDNHFTALAHARGVMILSLSSVLTHHLSSSELQTTESELKAMAMLAIQG